MSDRKPWSFCEKEGNKCTMNMCDEYGCQERKRVLVNDSHLVVVYKNTDQEKFSIQHCDACEQKRRHTKKHYGLECNVCGWLKEQY